MNFRQGSVQDHDNDVAIGDPPSQQTLIGSLPTLVASVQYISLQSLQQSIRESGQPCTLSSTSTISRAILLYQEP